jgi:hypothetical protein
VLLGEQERVHEVVDEQDVAHLAAVAVQGDRLVLERAEQEMGDPALVLVAALVRAVDAAHPEYDRGDAEGPGVVAHVLVGGAFEQPYGLWKSSRARFRDAPLAHFGIGRLVAAAVLAQRHVLEAAVDLVGRGEDQWRRRGKRAERFEQVQRAAGIHLEVVRGIGEAGGHCDLRGEVKHGGSAAHGLPQRGGVADVSHGNLQIAFAVGVAQAPQVRFHAGAGQVVENKNGAAGVEQAMRQVRADEPGPARDEDVFSH